MILIHLRTMQVKYTYTCECKGNKRLQNKLGKLYHPVIHSQFIDVMMQSIKNS